MKIYQGKLYPSRMRSYGGGGFELTPGEQEPGCPRLYRLKYEEWEKHAEFGTNLQHGGVVHRAIDYGFKNQMSSIEALTHVWTEVLGPESYEEVLSDLERFEAEQEHNPFVTLDTELELTAPLIDSPEPIRLAGFIDDISIDPQDPSHIIVTDYKTNRMPPSRMDVDRWIQGKTYAVLARANAHKWGIEDPVKVTTRFHAIKWRPISIVWTDLELDIFIAWAEAIARKILADDEGKPRLNPGCTWCPHKQTCPPYRNLPGKGKKTLLDKMQRPTLEEQSEFLQEAKETIRLLTPVVKDIEEAIKERVLHDGHAFDGGDGFEYRLNGKTRRVVTDTELMYGVVGEEYWDMHSPRLGDLDKWAKANPDAAPAVDYIIEKEPNGYGLARVLRKGKNEDRL